jgi:hypothetical protein
MSLSSFNCNRVKTLLMWETPGCQYDSEPTLKLLVSSVIHHLTTEMPLPYKWMPPLVRQAEMPGKVIDGNWSHHLWCHVCFVMCLNSGPRDTVIYLNAQKQITEAVKFKNAQLSYEPSFLLICFNLYCFPFCSKHNTLKVVFFLYSSSSNMFWSLRDHIQAMFS